MLAAKQAVVAQSIEQRKMLSRYEVYYSKKVATYVLGMKQYYNISIYCNIYYCNTIQYGLKEILICDRAYDN